MSRSCTLPLLFRSSDKILMSILRCLGHSKNPSLCNILEQTEFLWWVIPMPKPCEAALLSFVSCYPTYSPLFSTSFGRLLHQQKAHKEFQVEFIEPNFTFHNLLIKKNYNNYYCFFSVG
jgi:hypothetical protein